MLLSCHMYVQVLLCASYVFQVFLADLEKMIGKPLPSLATAAGSEQQASGASGSAPSSSTSNPEGNHIVTVDDLHSATYQAAQAGFKKGSVVCKKSDPIINFWRISCMHDCPYFVYDIIYTTMHTCMHVRHT